MLALFPQLLPLLHELFLSSRYTFPGFFPRRLFFLPATLCLCPLVHPGPLFSILRITRMRVAHGLNPLPRAFLLPVQLGKKGLWRIGLGLGRFAFFFLCCFFASLFLRPFVSTCLYVSVFCWKLLFSHILLCVFECSSLSPYFPFIFLRAIDSETGPFVSQLDEADLLSSFFTREALGLGPVGEGSNSASPLPPDTLSHGRWVSQGAYVGGAGGKRGGWGGGLILVPALVI